MPKPSSHKYSKKRNYNRSTYKRSYKKKRLTVQDETGNGPERKNVDSIISGQNINATGWSNLGTPTTLCISQGTGPNDRTGRKVMLRSYQHRASLSFPAGATAGRLVVVYDKQPNGAQALASEVFQTTTIESPLNLANSDRFVVLCDQMLIGDSTIGSGLSGYLTGEPCYRKVKLESIYGGPAIPISGHISIWAILNNSAASPSGPITVDSRVRFTDH